MIDPQSYSGSVNNGQAEPRMAGYVPVVGQQKSAEAQNFSQLVQKAGNGGPSNGASGDTAKSAGSSQGKHHGFLDFLTTLFDIINPLEHLPIISTIYEHVTGHHMNPVARIAGDTLYGGPIGTAVGVANVISEKKTGKDLGDNMIAMLTGHKGNKQTSDTMVAQNDAKPRNILWDDAPRGPATPDASTALASAASSGLSNVAPAAGSALSPATALAASPSAPPPPSAAAPKAAPPAKQNFPLLAAQQSHSANETGKTLADYAALRPLPAFDAKNRIPAAPGAQESAAPAPQAGSTPGSSVQNAPADAQERAVPPGLIAQKMMEGLDKYAALEKTRMSPSFNGTF